MAKIASKEPSSACDLQGHGERHDQSTHKRIGHGQRHVQGVAAFAQTAIGAHGHAHENIAANGQQDYADKDGGQADVTGIGVDQKNGRACRVERSNSCPVDSGHHVHMIDIGATKKTNL